MLDKQEKPDPRDGWAICATLYDPETDSVHLMSEDGQILASIPRNRVIEMTSLLPERTH